MTLLINGAPREVLRSANVAEMIDELGLPAPVTLVEHNGLALRRDEWLGCTLSAGDQIELVRIVAGG